MIKFATLATCLAALAAAPAHAAPAVWITNVKLVSPEKLDKIEAGSVLVKDGHIVSVVRGAGRMPAGATRVDGKGYYLTPGLIDSHVHLHAVPGMSLEQAKLKKEAAQAYYRQLPRSFLYYGYTTVIDLALADRAVIDDFRKAPLHPDVVHCAEPLVMANGYPSNYIDKATRFDTFPNFIHDAAQPAGAIPARFAAADYTPAKGVARVKDGGGICVKTHFERGFGAARNLPVMSPAVFGEVRSAATTHGLTLVTHANSFEAQQFAVAGNTDVLAHGMWHWGSNNSKGDMPAEMTALLERVVEKRIGFQATMQVLYGLRAYFDPEYLRNPGVAKVVPPAMVAWFGTPEGKWFKEEVAEDGGEDAVIMKGFDQPLRRQRQVVAYLAGRDANFVLGTDTPSSPTYGNLPGLNGYLEMQRLHEAGLSLAQVFKAATINNARTFKIDKRVGTIEAGKAANLLLMKHSPLADIKAYDSIETVWVRGEQVRRERLAADSAP